jgi:hypothetical protein
MILGSKKYRLTLFDGSTIEFHSMSAETADLVYSSLQVSQENPEYIEYIFHRLTENKYNLDDLNSGTILLVIYLSIKVSGLLKEAIDLPNLIEKSREQVANSVFFTLYSIIAKACPQYKLEDLQTKTVTELFTLLAFAERVAGGLLFDTKKLRKSLEEQAQQVVSDIPKKKGVEAVSREDIDQIKNILALEEVRAMR